jgi:hypothetical protein
MVTLKPDLNKYHSLRHYQNVANKCLTFHKTFLDLSVCFGGNPALVHDEGITFAIGTLSPLPSGGRRTRFTAVTNNSFGAAASNWQDVTAECLNINADADGYAGNGQFDRK